MSTNPSHSPICRVSVKESLVADGHDPASLEREISRGFFSSFGHLVNRLRLKYGKFKFSPEWQVIRDIEDCCSWEDVDDILVGYKFHPEKTKNPLLILVGATPTRKRAKHFYSKILGNNQRKLVPAPKKQFE